MELILSFVDLFLHVDEHLIKLVADYGVWVYAILFLIIFCETGLVVTPFLPGDSLLFAAGALCALGSVEAGGMNIFVLCPLLFAAAVLGNTSNYAIGYRLGPGWLEKKLSENETKRFRLLKKEHFVRTQRFFEKYGGKAIVLSRFVPIVRTIAPFVAGVGQMERGRFTFFNVVGAASWILICSLAGFFFGELPFVKKNFELVVLGIIFVSVLPIGVEMIKGWLEARRARPSPPA